MKINIGGTKVEKKDNFQSVGDSKLGSYWNKKPAPVASMAGRPAFPGGANHPQNVPGRGEKIVDWMISALLFLTVFGLPLFFVPNLPLFLELNKQVFLGATVGVAFLLWIGKVAWKGQVRFRGGFLLVPMVTLLAVYGLSTVFSTYREQSLWGYFGGEAESFINLLFFVAFFFLVFNIVRSTTGAKNLLLALLTSGVVTGAVTLLQTLGVFGPSTGTASGPSFNSFGSVYLLSVLLASLLLVATALFLAEQKNWKKAVFFGFSIILFGMLLVVNLKLLWWFVIFGLASVMVIDGLAKNKQSGRSRMIPLILLALSLVIVLWKKPIFKLDLPVEVLLNSRTSSSIALQSIRENPLLGYGPTNFGKVYKLFRPDDLGDFFATNFNGASSYFFDLASTTGLLGIAAFLFVVIYGAKRLLEFLTAKEEGDPSSLEMFERRQLAMSAGLVWVFLTLMLFLFSINITLLMAWWLLLALFFSLVSPAVDFVSNQSAGVGGSSRSSVVMSFVFIFAFVGFLVAIFAQSQKYAGAIHFNQAMVLDEKAGDRQKIIQELARAIDSDPGRDVFYRNQAAAMFAEASGRIAGRNPDDLSTEDANYISSMVAGAFASANSAIEMDRENSDNHLILAQLFEGVIGTMEKSEEGVVKSYEEAIKYDPRNPNLLNRLANVYVKLAEIEAAKDQEKNQSEELPQASKNYLGLARDFAGKAIEQNKDFDQSHILLAGIYQREGDGARALDKLKENVELFASDPGSYFRLGMFYYQDGKTEEAIVEFRRALGLNKNYSNAMYFLGLALDKNGDGKGALENFRKVAELNPDNGEVKEVIANLEAGRPALQGLVKDQTPEFSSEEENDQVSQPDVNSVPEISPQPPVPAENLPAEEE